MNATRIQINGRNAIALVLAVVMVALTAALVLATPELVVARPYAASSEIAAETSLLAENPELMMSRRYAASSEIAAEAALLSANPELMVARRYVPPGGWTRRMPQHVPLHNKVDPDRDIGLLEFSKPQTIKEVSTRDQLSSSLASNPELSVARRYAARGVIAGEAAFLAANPELMVARRYAALPEGRAHQHLDDY